MKITVFGTEGSSFRIINNIRISYWESVYKLNTGTIDCIFTIMNVVSGQKRSIGKIKLPDLCIPQTWRISYLFYIDSMVDGCLGKASHQMTLHPPLHKKWRKPVFSWEKWMMVCKYQFQRFASKLQFWSSELIFVVSDFVNLIFTCGIQI